MNDVADTGILDQLMRIAYLIQHDMAHTLSGTGLNPARVHLLWELNQRGPSTQQSLAKALDVTPANITGLVDALETHGFAERRRHPTDRRATLVTLAERGEAAMRTMERDRVTFAEALVQDLDDDQRRHLHGALNVVADRMEIITKPTRESKVET